MAFFCFVVIISQFPNGFLWPFHPRSLGLIHRLWGKCDFSPGKRKFSPAPVSVKKTLADTCKIHRYNPRHLMIKNESYACPTDENLYLCHWAQLGHVLSTHWVRNKMADIMQTLFSNAFCKYIMLFFIQLSLKLYYEPNQQYISTGSAKGLVLNRNRTIIWANDALHYQRIDATRGLRELINNNCFRLIGPIF